MQRSKMMNAITAMMIGTDKIEESVSIVFYCKGSQGKLRNYKGCNVLWLRNL